jgi:glutamate-1-semialdehyde 2,1-aminomutase
VDLSRTRELQQRLDALIPGGGHTYAKGADQYPELSPGVIARGRGCHVWDPDGNEYIEYGMGLRAVALGHAYEPVLDAVRASLPLGTNFTRPAAIEAACAELFTSIVPSAEMVKFTKDGSTATSAALRLARAATGRELVAICEDHPFFSYDDWFISTTTSNGGIPPVEADRVRRFRYNDLDSVDQLFDQWGDDVAAVFLEPVRTEAPVPGFLEGLRERCDRSGSLLVFDEMITGFRYSVAGGQSMYGVAPDLSTWGKALANGFSVSALCGRRDLMMLGSRARNEDDVFLLSTTHGAEVCSLAAAIATMNVYLAEPVVEHLYRQGDRLAQGMRDAAVAHGVDQFVMPVGFGCNLVFATHDAAGEPSQAYRTLFLQETTARGVLMPSLVVSYSHTDDDVERTIEAIDGALAVYAKGLDAGSTDGLLVGSPSRHVFERRFSVEA